MKPLSKFFADSAQDERDMQAWANQRFPGQITVERAELADTMDLFSIHGPAGCVSLGPGRKLDLDLYDEVCDSWSTIVSSGSIGNYDQEEEFNLLENALRRACEIVVSGKF